MRKIHSKQDNASKRMDSLGGDGSGDGAGRGRGRGPWISTTQELPALRRPHHSTSPESRDTEQSKSDTSYDDILQTSKLSVDAAEFIPKSYPVKQPSHQPQQQSSIRYSLTKHSIQDRLKLAREIPLRTVMMQRVQNSGCNYDAPQHYQQIEQVQYENFSHHQQEQPANVHDYGHFDGGSGDYKDKHQDSSGDEDSYLIELANTTQNLMSVIHSLILNPGRFTSIVPALIDNLKPYLQFPSHFQEILKIIIQQSINEGNFRYSGARLCASLDTSASPAEQTTFRQILYILCKNETESQASNWKQKNDHTEDEQKKCHGLILFLAELVTQMEHTSAFGLGDLLIQLIIITLKKPAPNSVKNICQALKLAGHTLEKDKGGSHKDMEIMMRTLTELVTAGRVDSHVGRMVNSVHELRNGNWGQISTADTSVESTEHIDPNQAVDEPVFYGPDGKVLTAEENQFLEGVAYVTTNVDNHVILEHSFEDESKWLSEDDDDIDAAYEEFLKEIPNQPKKQQARE
ncbi:polyadenylate-binding protein-interacting protein 1 [Hylaeus anthracinus]|uniref:polyadenylate-binding protein-interacting protein 1 n=1 Tax=Hylaeus anthracinus TaxID=313031 RepID=UPI0023BA05A2|nr:polyadenylate-binding protein-interacting protein 1 [Hylaeus anthracinus]